MTQGADVSCNKPAPGGTVGYEEVMTQTADVTCNKPALGRTVGYEGYDTECRWRQKKKKEWKEEMMEELSAVFLFVKIFVTQQSIMKNRKHFTLMQHPFDMKIQKLPGNHKPKSVDEFPRSCQELGQSVVSTILWIWAHHLFQQLSHLSAIPEQSRFWGQLSAPENREFDSSHHLFLHLFSFCLQCYMYL